ncbi:MAG: hypothetical protein Q4G63_03310, partial [Bacteroidia bacterium]|nr:hypothetical protein [Bacteroidia bacterium]
MKVLRKLLIVLAVLIFHPYTFTINAQGVKNHEFKMFYGTAYSGSVSDMFGANFGNDGSDYRNFKMGSFGVVGTGYRFTINRFKVGLDLGFSTVKEEFYKNDKLPAQIYYQYRFLVLPVGEFTYYRNRFLRFYGAIGAGIIVSRKVNKDDKINAIMNNEFAYQINPVGLRVG